MEEVKEGVIDIDLTDYPIIQYLVTFVSIAPLTIAVNAEEWVQQGCLHATRGQWEDGQQDRRLTLKQAKTLSERMGMKPW